MFFYLYMKETGLTTIFIELLSFAWTGLRKLGKEQVEQEDFYYLHKYGDHLMRLAMAYLHNKSDAEDIVQEPMIQLIKKQPEFVNANHEKAWLYRVTIDLAKNRLKANSRRNFEPLSESLSETVSEDFSYLWEAIAGLTDLQRSIIHLFYYEGYATKEIAKLLVMKESTVRSYLYRSREQLKKELKGRDISESRTNL